MSLSVASAFLVFMFITAFTPGPNNILALSTGIRRGFKGSIPVLAGICAGFFCVMFLCCLFVLSLSSLSATFIEVMKYAGCLYIIWLAWKIATAVPGDSPQTRSKADFVTGFVLQFINIKIIIIYGMTAYSGFIFPCYGTAVLPLTAGMCILTAMGSAGTVTWAFAGSVLQRVFRRHARLLNTVMAIMLLACIIPILSYE